MPKEKYTNLLIHESSPYLLQHAHNPVHWFPWGEKALKKAEAEDKPLLISIGYAACHWCHVMERESYADEEVAKYMNEHFVSIKVDREERTDVDQIYMDAAMVLNGNGGWPLNAFALPDGKPFFVLTYLPKKDWLNLLKQITAVYRDQRNEAVKQAEAITHGIKQKDHLIKSEETPSKKGKKNTEELFATVEESIDFEWGGFNRTPKFPLPVAWEWMLQEYALHENEKALEAVTTTLTKMARGGIYDQLGGGFARYSTDSFWVVPHFEKMLYDNGQLVSLYAQAYKVTKDPLYEKVIRETLGFVERELQHKSGGFYSSLNADSEGEEGKYYVWNENELLKLLPPEKVGLFLKFYRIQSSGNWEDGKNILFHTQNDVDFAKENHLGIKEWQKIKEEAHRILFKKREERIRPSTDDKILTSWNALMLKGYIQAYQALGEPSFLETALKNARFLRDQMLKKDGSLWRNFKDGKTSIPGLLEDYAFVAEAFIDLYQVTFNVGWLEIALQLTEYVWDHFSDPEDQFFFYTSDLSETLIARKKELEDSVQPASNSVMAWVLYRLGLLYDRPAYLERTAAMAAGIEHLMHRSAPYFSKWAQLAGLLEKGAFEVAILGEESRQRALELQQTYLPTSLFLGGSEENLPLLEQKNKKGKTIIYVCKNKMCLRPVETTGEALEQLKNKN